jgi:hypothetical protein
MVPFKRLSIAAVLGAVWVGTSALVSCSSSSNPAPPVYGNSDASTDATTNGASADGEAGAVAEPEATTADDSESPDAGEATVESTVDAGDAAFVQDAAVSDACVSALSDAGCWVCPSASTGSVAFLNQCAGTGVKCVSFDNATRLPTGYDGGLN